MSQIKLCAVTGATAAIVQIFDRLKNRDGSWLSNAASAISAEVTSVAANKGLCILAVLLLLLVAGALASYAYKPSNAKEAFILGAGLMGILTPTVQSQSSPPPLLPTTAQVSHAPQPSSTPQKVSARDEGSWSFPFISSAHAQTQDTAPALPTPEPAKPVLQKVQIDVKGPQQLRMPETRVTIYSEGRPFQAFSSTTQVQTALPPGKYEVELAHSGYRSQIFPLEVNAATPPLSVTMDKAGWDSFDNFFGPKRTTAESLR